MRGTPILLCLAGILSTSHAQLTNQVPGVRDRFELLRDRARSLHPEFAADLLIRLAPLGSAPPGMVVRRFEEALSFATRAREPLKLVLVSGFLDSRDGAIAGGHIRNLNRLSLSLAAVQGIHARDPLRAIELLREIRLPDLASTSCSASLSPDPTAYYKLIGSFSASLPFREDRDRTAYLRWIESITLRMSHSSEIQALAVFLENLPFSAGESRGMIAAFVARLSDMPVSYRDLSHRSGPRMSALRRLHERIEPTWGDQLIAAARSYVVRGAKQNPCPALVRANQPADPVAEFNKVLAPLASAGRDFRIRPEDLGDLPPPSVRQPFAPTFRTRSDLTERLRQLRFGSDEKIKDTDRWAEQYRTLLRDVADWQPAGDDPERHFHHKVLLLLDLCRMPSTASTRNLKTDAQVYFGSQPGAVREGGAPLVLAQFLSGSQGLTLQRQHPLIWHRWLMELIDFAKLQAEPSRTRILELIRDVGDPVMGAYASVELI